MIKGCVVCGNEFEARGSQNTCGDTCRKMNRTERQHLWAQTHPENVRESQRKWAETHPDEKRERFRKWVETHPENVRESQRRYSESHTDEKRERFRKWYETNIEAEREKARIWIRDNPGAARESHRRWRTSDRGRAAHSAQKHNRRVRLNGIPLTADVVLELKTEYGGICPYCNQPIVKGHIDHIVPVSKGGTNDRENLVWVCANCNRQKNNKGLLQFMLCRLERILSTNPLPG